MSVIKVLFLTIVMSSMLVMSHAQTNKDTKSKSADSKTTDSKSDPPSMDSVEALKRMKKNQLGLYEALHSFALPDIDTSKPVNQRFILQIPGKVLNPMDYYPGDEYEKYLKNPHKSQKEVQIPPMVMEKMFQLSDVVPGSNSLAGGETGYSLARIYENILGTMDVINFAELTAIDNNIYDESLDKLLELMPDPNNPGKEVPLLQLYSTFQDAYHEEQRKMEDAIKEKQKNSSAVEYQLWFQRHFHILNAKVEGAYTRWLLYGRKHLVESYIAHFDITSSGEILEDARVKLRSSGSSSLDRSQTVYPVSFTPSNWYEYLKNKEAPLTRDQIQAKLESVKTRINLLNAMLESTSTELDGKDKRIEKMKEDQKAKDEKLKSVTKNLEEARKSCWFSPFIAQSLTSTCDIRSKEGEVQAAFSESSAANLRIESLEFQFGAKSQMKDQINVVLAKLNTEREHLERELAESKPSSSSSLVDDVGTTEPFEPQEIQDNWAMFDFSSTESSKETKARSFDTKNSASFSYAFVASASVSASVGHQSFSEHVKSADVKVRAKLLKVKINRPWFRTDLFTNREFTLQRQVTPVSPGPMLDKSFSDLTYDQYLLYQYPSAFLLAKDVSMEFSGLDAKTKQTALTASFGISAKGGYGPFSFGGSSQTSASGSNMRASSTADGLKIEIPGAQLIGYYCDVLPKFPNPIIM